DAIRDFIKDGKPVLFCFGPTSEPAGQMDQLNIPNDRLEDDLAQLGIKLGKQTVLYDVESKAFGQRRGNLLIMGANLVDVPPVKFDWPSGADQVPGQIGTFSSNPDPIRESLRLTARSLGKNQTLDLRIRHPRPVYYVPTPASSLPYDPTFMVTDAASWNDSNPFPTRDHTPRYEPPKSDLLTGDPDQMRRGPFPTGVALETSVPRDWYTEKDAQPKKTRVAAIGHGGVFIGPNLSPAKEKLLLDTCNWLLGRDDLLTKGGEENRWQYPRLILAD